MKYLKEYRRPKFSIIKISIEEQLLAGSEIDMGGNGDPDAKRMTYRIFDDSFDNDLSIAEESDYATTTNTIEVW